MILPYMELCENRKTKKHEYFKYADVTNEIPINDLLFNINIFNTNIINSFRDINIQARSLACAARLVDTKCPPEAPFCRLGSHCLIICEITSLHMSILVLKSSLEKSQNLSIKKFLMRNDDVITK